MMKMAFSPSFSSLCRYSQVDLPRMAGPMMGELSEPNHSSMKGDPVRSRPTCWGCTTSFCTDGKESFKGSGFVRGGIYDRIQVHQEGDSFTFRDTDVRNLYSLAAKGAPQYSESGIFIIRSRAFSAAYPWKLSFLSNKIDRNTGSKVFTSFESEYWTPAQYMVGGRPEVHRPDPSWLKIWKAKWWQLIIFGLMLTTIAVVYAYRETLTRMSSRKNKWPVNGFKYPFWAIFVVWVGFGLLAQPSVTQVLTWFHSILFKWEWTLFLSDPFLFLFWIFIFITVFVFGRGLFCGWACPFGSLQEGLHVIGEKIGLKKYQFLLPPKWHHKLKWVKYGVFFVLLVVSLFSMVDAEKLAEVEPFKTTFLVGITNRPWPYGTFVLVILGLAVFTERPYCKYICPPGRLAGHAQHVPLVRPQAQARLQQVQGLCQGLRRPGHQRERPDRPPRVPALPGLPDPLHGRQCLPTTGEGTQGA